MQKDWSKSEVKQFRKLLEEGNSITEICPILKRSRSSLERAVKTYNLQGVGKEMRMATNVMVATDSKPTKKEIVNANLDLIKKIKEDLVKVKPYKIKRSIKSKEGDTLIVQFTDWHVGRVVKDTEGNITFDVSIFETRINILLQEILKLLDNNIKKGTPIKDVVIACCGDIADGQGIFAEQNTMLQFAPPYQVKKALEIIQKFILALLERGLPVTFYGVKGNHGEIRVAGKSIDPDAHWDLMLYLMLDWWQNTMLKSDKLKIVYSQLDYLIAVIRGWRYLIRHQAPNQSETPSGKAKLLGWNKLHTCVALIFGHFHHWGVWDKNGITCFRGGALSGGDDLSEEMGESSDIVQLIWGCHDKRKLTFLYPVDLGGKE